jgi:hypothetical protein
VTDINLGAIPSQVDYWTPSAAIKVDTDYIFNATSTVYGGYYNFSFTIIKTEDVIFSDLMLNGQQIPSDYTLLITNASLGNEMGWYPAASNPAYDYYGNGGELLPGNYLITYRLPGSLNLSIGGSLSLQFGVYVSFPAMLFTTGADPVNFNNLQPAQQAAIAGGADIYHGFGGNDVVTLPNVANYKESVGNGATLGWNSAQTFTTGSLVGQAYQVNGGDGSYNIALGAGTDSVRINGSGNSTVAAGTGVDTISIASGGSLKVTGSLQGSATIGQNSTLELSGDDTGSITFSGSGGTLEIDSVLPTAVISEFSTSDLIDLKNTPASGLNSATVRESNTQLQLKVNGVSSTLNIAQAAPYDLAFVADNTVHSEFTPEAADPIGDKEAGIVLEGVKSILTAIAALKMHQGGLTLEEFNAVFGPAFAALSVGGLEATTIYQNLQKVVGAPNATPAQITQGWKDAVTAATQTLVKYGLGVVISTATEHGLTLALTAGVDAIGFSAAGTVSEFAAGLAIGAGILEAPVVLGVAAGFATSVAFLNFYESHWQVPVDSWIQTNIVPLVTNFFEFIGFTLTFNDLALSGSVTGPYNFIDLLNLEASYSDLAHAFGANTQAMRNWYNGQQPIEKRLTTFDGLDYIASYSDLMNAFKSAGSQQAVLDAGANHYIVAGMIEGRTTTFNGLDYIASYDDLIQAFGAKADAGAYHYIESGASEGRTATFDGLEYVASYADLIKAIGANEQAGAAHYIQAGHGEGRTTTFDGLDYIAGNADLMQAFGANADAGAAHYIQAGFLEGRAANAFNVAAYESAHPDLIGKYASNDAFLTAYISTYVTTGTFLT